jgi:5-methylcytosine-specific restriction endonuclease McrA
MAYKNEEDKKEYARKYYIANRERLLEWQHQYEINHIDEKKEYLHKYYVSHFDVYKERRKNWILAHPEREKENTHRWNINNPEKIKKYDRKWAASHPDKIIEKSNRRRARKAAASGSGITAKQERQLKEEYSHRCAYCGKQKPLALDHVVPLSRGGAHDISNVVPACKSCNSSKHNKSLLIWMYDKIQWKDKIPLLIKT